MAIAEIDYSELTKFEQNFLASLQEHPKECKKFMNKAGSKLRVVSKRQYTHDTKKKTGNLLKGLRKGKAYLYSPDNAFCVRVYNVAPHSHLIELGHDIWVHGKYTGKSAKGKNILDKAAKSYENAFIGLTDKYIDKMLEKGYTW